MDVGIQMIFSTYGWPGMSDREAWQEEIRLARLADEIGFRRHLVGRAPLLRLFVLPGQHAAPVVSRATLHARGPRHRGDHPAVE